VAAATGVKKKELWHLINPPMKSLEHLEAEHAELKVYLAQEEFVFRRPKNYSRHCRAITLSPPRGRKSKFLVLSGLFTLGACATVTGPPGKSDEQVHADVQYCEHYAAAMWENSGAFIRCVNDLGDTVHRVNGVYPPSQPQVVQTQNLQNVEPEQQSSIFGNNSNFDRQPKEQSGTQPSGVDELKNLIEKQQSHRT
jgi:hypothetical protein